MEGNGYGVIEVRSQHLPGGAEKLHYLHLRLTVVRGWLRWTGEVGRMVDFGVI
jgi:hypothetical protein